MSKRRNGKKLAKEVLIPLTRTLRWPIYLRCPPLTIHFANISFHYLFYHAICQLIHFKMHCESPASAKTAGMFESGERVGLLPGTLRAPL
jgi:hypothetical protein